MLEDGDNTYSVHVGGSNLGLYPSIKAIYAALLNTLHQTLVFASCITCLPWFESRSKDFRRIQTEINLATKT